MDRADYFSVGTGVDVGAPALLEAAIRVDAGVAATVRVAATAGFDASIEVDATVATVGAGADVAGLDAGRAYPTFRSR